eukprot:GDKI01001361.1.p2 GENE.GDKI01001361.1~~GDKI01001361.1.p2  ORF type:complete len:169 (-),score=49.33 GDKI01001361.1:440-946(-)
MPMWHKHLVGCVLCGATGIVALCLSLLTIAIAWLVYRPAIGGILLLFVFLIGGAAVYYRWHLNGKKWNRAGTSMPGYTKTPDMHSAQPYNEVPPQQYGTNMNGPAYQMAGYNTNANANPYNPNPYDNNSNASNPYNTTSNPYAPQGNPYNPYQPQPTAPQQVVLNIGH